jgi:D-cysteine desulfhydrase
VGALGCAYAARELAHQLPEASATVIVASGSGGTQAGLVAGQVAFSLPLHVVAASVSRPLPEATAQVTALAQDCARLLGKPEPGASDIDLRDAVGPGFGVAADDDRDSAALALRQEGLLLDDTYTAKSMTLLRRLVREGVEGPFVFWHSGGQTAALATLGRELRSTGGSE